MMYTLELRAIMLTHSQLKTNNYAGNLANKILLMLMIFLLVEKHFQKIKVGTIITIELFLRIDSNFYR